VLANTAVEVVAAWDVADAIATESIGGRESVMTLVGGSDGSGIYQTLPVAAAGTLTPPNVAVVGGTDGTDARQLSTDTAGAPDPPAGDQHGVACSNPHDDLGWFDPLRTNLGGECEMGSRSSFRSTAPPRRRPRQ
jgi:hypothetical protein